MNIAVLLEQEHSKSATERIVSWIGDHQQRFDQLMELFLNGENRMVQRAAWPLSYCAIQHPELIKKHYGSLLKRLNAPGQPSAVPRNILRLLDQGPLPPKTFHGTLMDKCFYFIEDPNAPIAVKAFSLGILYRLTTIYPEIAPELVLIIDTHFEKSTAAFRSRARKIRKSLSQ
ncbi:hypothetical protein [Niabella terrae]